MGLTNISPLFIMETNTMVDLSNVVIHTDRMALPHCLEAEENIRSTDTKGYPSDEDEMIWNTLPDT